MPRERGEEYYTDQEFFPIFSKLNALFPQTSPWEETKARKEHKDLFGEIIQPGEIYYKRQDGMAFDENTKLSRLSMERLLHALFGRNWGLNELAAVNYTAGRLSMSG